MMRIPSLPDVKEVVSSHLRAERNRGWRDLRVYGGTRLCGDSGGRSIYLLGHRSAWRSALVFAIVVASGCGSDPNAPTIKAIHQLRGEIERDEQGAGKPIVIARLMDRPVKDEDLASIVTLTRLRELYLSRTKITDAGLVELVALPELQKLDLFDTAVTDAGMEHIAKLRALTRLGLGNTKITNKGLETLRPLKQLRELYVSGTKITDAAMTIAKDFPRLRQFDALIRP